jgi:predicted kinase
VKKLTICRGLPASGKTTWTKDRLLKEPIRPTKLNKGTPAQYQGAVRVNMDDLRLLLHGERPFSQDQEQVTHEMRNALIVAGLRLGLHVYSDDTNLNPKTLKAVHDCAIEGTEAGHEAPVELKDFTDVPIDECLARNARRANPVPEHVIKRMHRQHLHKEEDRHAYLPETPGLPFTVMCDLDGTMAILNGRDPYDASTCGKDKVNLPVLRLVVNVARACHSITFLSARMATYRAQTEAWLQANVVPHLNGCNWVLHMRAEGDTRKDEIVKEELYRTHIEGKFNVICAFDDRNRVVRLWRRLGIPTMQVADGDF